MGIEQYIIHSHAFYHNFLHENYAEAHLKL